MARRQNLMRVSIAALLMLGLAAAGCAGSEEAAEAPAAEAPAPEPVVEETPVALDRAVLADPTRPEDEVGQDADRHAIDVYEFIGIEPGMTVGDIWPGGGYNTHLLSRLMGAEGKVYAVMGFYAAGRFATLEPLTQRIADSGLDNVEIVLGLADMEDESLDAAIAVRNYHDAEGLGAGRQETVTELARVMKRGGIVGIVEVATPNPGFHEETHRLNEATVVEEFTAGGFELVERSDMLANPDDDHTTTGFEEGRHTRDRYVLKFRKS